MLVPIDNIGFTDDPEIKATISGETLYYANEVSKIKYSWIRNAQKRNLVITDEALYNFKNKVKKRRIDLADLKGITISKVSDEFIIHGNQKEYDYVYVSKDRFTIIQTLQELFQAKTGKELLFCIKKDKELKNFEVCQKERAKNSKCFKINPEEFMSIREFLESKGNLNINTHANSYNLENEIKNKNTFYQEESLSNFNVICLLAVGKTANIYLAEYQGEHVALKVFDKLTVLKNNWAKKVILEKKILTMLSTESDKKVAAFFGTLKFCFMTDTKIVFVMPFYQGGDLFSLLEKNGTFDESTTAFYGVQIAYMIDYLHKKNIVYRDLKPENLMVMPNGYLKLIDFGSCKIIEEKVELECSFEGGVDFMSPEMVSGEGHSFATDWWSYGALLYELLYGEPPFNDEHIERILDLITISKVRFPSKKKLAPHTIDLLQGLLEKNPLKRIGNTGFDEVTKQPIFESLVVVSNIVSQKTNAPKQPSIDNDNLTCNFDNLYLNMDIENFDDATDIGYINQNQDQLEDLCNNEIC